MLFVVDERASRRRCCSAEFRFWAVLRAPPSKINEEIVERIAEPPRAQSKR